MAKHYNQSEKAGKRYFKEGCAPAKIRNHSMHYRLQTKVFVAWLLLSLLTVLTFIACAEVSPNVVTVKVGMENSGLFLTLDKEGKPVAGYAFEYIETIAAYSGWEVEYVLFSGFGEMLEAVYNGDVDITYDVSYSPERKELLSYPDTTMGTEEYYLYCLPDNQTIRAMDYSTYDGKSIGVTIGTLQVDMLNKWCEEKGISLHLVEFASVPEKEAALEAGEIDLDLEISMLASRGFSPLDKIAGSDYYLVVNKDRPDILTDINTACAKITSIDRGLFRRLEDKYFSRTLITKSLASDEAAWVSEHDTLKIGFMKNYLPFSNTGKDGEVSGIVKDIVPLMLENIGILDALQLEYTGYDDNDAMYTALSTGEVDCIFPVCGSMNYALGQNAQFSSPVIGISVDLAFFEDTLATDTIAVNSRNQLQDYYTKTYFPNADILYCDTIDACLDAVLTEKAGSTILNGMRTAELLGRRMYESLRSVRLPDNAELSFAIKDGNSSLLSIINRALANTDDSAAVTFSYKNLIADTESITPVEFFRAHPGYVYAFIVLLFAIVLAFDLYKRKLERKDEETKRRELIARMKGGVSSYIVNPTTERFMILSQNPYLAKKYPSSEDFHTSITRYITSDVYEPDREYVARTITVAAIVHALETQDDYIIRYRDISSGAPRWYEMQAVRLSETEILYGFTDRNNEIISKIVLDKLAAAYTALYYVNLDTDDYVPYHLVQKTEDIRQYYGTSPKFVNLAHDFASSVLVHPDDCDSVTGFYSSAAEMKESLKDRKSVSLLFRRNYGGEYLWTEISCLKCEAEHAEAHTMIVGFIEKDQEVKERTAQLKAAEESEKLLSNLASYYDIAYIVNMEDDSLVLLKYDARMPGKDRNFETFADFRKFFLSFVPGPEQKQMQHVLQYDTIRERLSTVTSYDTEYRCIMYGEAHWGIMNIAYVDATHIAVGFANRDLEILKKHLQEMRYDEYFALFEVDLDTQMLRIVKNTEHYQVYPVGTTIPYVSYIQQLAMDLDDEPRAFYMQLSDIDYIRNELATENKRTYSYKSSHIGNNDTWIDVTIYVVLRHDDGAPSIFTLGLNIVDAYAKSRQEMQAQLKEAYRQIRDANLRNDLLYDIAHAVKWSYEIDSDGRVVLANYEDRTSIWVDINSPDNPMRWVELLHPEDRDQTVSEFMATISDKTGKRPYEVTYRLLYKNGTYHWIKSSGRLLYREDGSSELIGMSINITDQMEKEREQQERLEAARNAADEANKSKTNFLFNMSHDIRTPMNAITGFTSMAKKHQDDKEKVRDYLDKIDTSGQQLLVLINQVLEMARIESGKSELVEHPVSVCDEYNTAVTVLSEQAKVNGLKFHHYLENITHNYVLADSAKMSSITLNITGNALKYTPTGGCVDFRLKEIPPEKEGYATYVFTVIDTGIGMSEEYLKVLFDPFTREKSSTVSKIQGTGLGMSIVKELVDMVGGTIAVQSKPGEGTRFDITASFKIDETEGAGTGSESEPGSESIVSNTLLSLKGRRVLLVEDNALNREIATAILEEEGLSVEEATDGETAVEILRDKGPDYYDFILMDIQMPLMNGYEATKAIRKMYPGKRIPIIALSANAFAEDRTTSIAAGMDDHVAKPINVHDLLTVLSKFL